jgi:hypothetical protein
MSPVKVCISSLMCVMCVKCGDIVALEVEVALRCWKWKWRCVVGSGSGVALLEVALCDVVGWCCVALRYSLCIAML